GWARSLLSPDCTALARCPEKGIIMRTPRALILLILLLPVAGWTQTTPLATGQRSESEQFICHFDLSTNAAPPIFSPDIRRMAYVTKVGNKLAVVVDGNEEKSYDLIGVGSLIFSPNSRRVAYVAIVGKKAVVVVDGKEEKSYNAIGTGPFFSPDSRRVAYAAKVGA